MWMTIKENRIFATLAKVLNKSYFLTKECFALIGNNISIFL
jgi:hypothetical protein